MRTPAVFVAAAVAAFVGFYAGLWALLAVAGLEGASGSSFGAATVGGAGLLAGAAASAVATTGLRKGVGFSVAGALFGALAGWIVDAVGGDAVWGGFAALTVALVVATAVVDDGGRPSPAKGSPSHERES